jgi:hypothetical protein
MGLLRRKEEKSETMTVRVPASVKAELEELRQQADAAGFDLTATLTEALVRLTRQLREELGQPDSRGRGAGRKPKANGLAEGNGLG